MVEPVLNERRSGEDPVRQTDIIVKIGEGNRCAVVVGQQVPVFSGDFPEADGVGAQVCDAFFHMIRRVGIAGIVIHQCLMTLKFVSAEDHPVSFIHEEQRAVAVGRQSLQHPHPAPSEVDHVAVMQKGLPVIRIRKAAEIAGARAGVADRRGIHRPAL